MFVDDRSCWHAGQLYSQSFAADFKRTMYSLIVSFCDCAMLEKASRWTAGFDLLVTIFSSFSIISFSLREKKLSTVFIMVVCILASHAEYIWAGNWLLGTFVSCLYTLQSTLNFLNSGCVSSDFSCGMLICGLWWAVACDVAAPSDAPSVVCSASCCSFDTLVMCFRMHSWSPMLLMLSSFSSSRVRSSALVIRFLTRLSAYAGICSLGTPASVRSLSHSGFVLARSAI